MARGPVAGVSYAFELFEHARAAFFAPGDELIGTRMAPTMLSDPRDVWVLVTNCALMLAFYFASQYVLFPPLGAALGVAKHRSRQKFASSFRELIYYSTSLAMSFRFAWRYEWMRDYKLLWPGGAWTEVAMELKFMYLLEISWYVAGIVYMVLDVANRKKDFKEMMLHHFITAFLTGFSYSIGEMRVGIIVMLLHNVADPPLHVAKCCNYLAPKGLIKDVFFAIFALLFIVVRLCYYPFVILSAVTNGPGVTRCGAYSCTTGMEFALTIALAALLPIHIYWIALILKMALRMFSGELGEDIREKESDDED